MKPDFSKEDLTGTPVEYAPGAWVAGDLHYPGGVKNMRVNNRAFIFKLTLQQDLGGVKKGDECLFVFGAGNKPIVDSVKKLEQRTGLKAVAMMSNGGGHHVSLKHWFEAFPEMAIWVTPTRVPSTENAKNLIQQYPDRWELADNTTVPHHTYQLLHYFGSGDDMQVDCIIFNQFYGYSDEHSKECGIWTEPDDEPEYKPGSWVFTNFSKLSQDASAVNDDICFFHKASGLLVTGHQFQFAYTPKGYSAPEELHFEGSFVFTKLIEPTLYKQAIYTTSMGSNLSRLRDPKIHAEQWNEVMKWDFEYACSHHDPVGVCGPLDDTAIMNSDGGVKGHLQRELEKSGELTGEAVAGSWCPWQSPNAVYKATSKEDAYRKKYGKPPVLPMGGPGYDAHGYRKS